MWTRVPSELCLFVLQLTLVECNLYHEIVGYLFYIHWSLGKVSRRYLYIVSVLMEYGDNFNNLVTPNTMKSCEQSQTYEESKL